MQTGFEHSFFQAESVLLAAAVVVAVIAYVLHRLRRARPEFCIGRAVACGLAVRVLALTVLGAVAPQARGTDEDTFLDAARALHDVSFTSAEAVEAFTTTFHVWLFSMQLRIPDFPEFAMRLFQIGFSVLGLIFLVAAVHDLAGPRAARIAAWATMLEPSGVFFSSFLHKEPFMVLAGGIVAFGGVRLWQRRDLVGVPVMVAGAVIATLSRPYAGAMLCVAVAAIGLHGSLSRRVSSTAQRRSIVGLAIIVVLLLAATPTALEQISNEQLQERLQMTQDINTSGDSNLKLDPVDFSTRTNIILNLPDRMADVALRPYPWELGSANQRLGLPGSLAAIAVLFLLLRELALARGRAFRWAGPILYPAAMLFVAFSISAGNAGTSFRLRSTVVALAIGAFVVIRARRTQQQAQQQSPVEQPAVAAPGRAGAHASRQPIHI